MTRTLFLVLCPLITGSACTGRDVVARVGDRELRRTDLDLHRKQLGARQLSDEALLEQLIQRERLADRAQKLGLATKPDVEARLRAAAREVLADAALSAALDSKSEAEAAERFKKDPKRYEVRSVEIAQLVFSTTPTAPLPEQEAARSRATAAWARLLGGDDFAELAKRVSEDPASAARGGVIGRIHEGEIDQKLFEALLELPEGGYTKPMPGPAGFHVFKALSAPSKEQPTFEAIKGKILAQLRSEAERELNESLERSTAVRRYPEHLTEASP